MSDALIVSITLAVCIGLLYLCMPSPWVVVEVHVLPALLDILVPVVAVYSLAHNALLASNPFCLSMKISSNVYENNAIFMQLVHIM